MTGPLSGPPWMRAPIRHSRRGATLPRWLLALAWILIGVAGLAAPAAAGGRLVAIVFDDSGSMRGRIHLPGFGAQLLVSTLDGRPGRDRLFTARLSAYERALGNPRSGVLAILRRHRVVSSEMIEELGRLGLPDLPRIESIETPDAQQALISAIREDWNRTDADTPYELIELTLSRLVAQTGLDDEAFLLIITDGEFSSGGERPAIPDSASLERSYQAYRARLQGKLRAEFILIAPRDDSGQRLRAIVRQQGVRSGLLKVFNGSETDGSHEVSSVPELLGTLFTVIARIGATDRSDRSDITRIDGPTVTIASPFSIARIISIATGSADGQVPQIVSTSLGAAPAAVYQSRMREADTAAGWSNERLQAITTHYLLSPPAPPGPLTLTYHQPLGQDVVLLFETAARFDLAVRDDQGRVVPPGADGIIELFLGRPYQLEGILIDAGNPASPPPAQGAPATRGVPVDFATIPPSTQFTTWRVDRSGQRSGLPLSRDDPGDRVLAALPTDREQEYEVGGTFSLPGFVIKESRPLGIRVVDALVDHRISVEPVHPCPNCGPDELLTAVRPGTDDDVVARIGVAQVAGRPSQFTIALENAPGWLVLRDESGAVVPHDRPIAIREGDTAGFRLERRRSGLAELFGQRSFPLLLRTRPLAPHRGEREQPLRLTLETPDVTISYAGSTRGGPDDAPLALSGADVARGDQQVFFEIANAPEPLQPEQVTVEPASGLLDFPPPTVRGARVSVAPRSDWCLCVLWVAGVPEEVTITYRFVEGVAPVHAVGPLRFAPTMGELLSSCLRLLVLLLLLVYLALVVRAWLTTFQFPRRSLAEILDRNAALPRYEDLHRFNWRLLRCLLLRRGHERRAVEGLLLEARPDGAAVILRDSDGGFMVERLGQSLGLLREEQPSLREFVVFWGEKLSRARGPKSLVLLRSFEH